MQITSTSDEEYNASNTTRFPVKWTAPEAALYGQLVTFFSPHPLLLAPSTIYQNLTNHNNDNSYN